jgi:hypothetical protein
MLEPGGNMYPRMGEMHSMVAEWQHLLRKWSNACAATDEQHHTNKEKCYVYFYSG